MKTLIMLILFSCNRNEEKNVLWEENSKIEIVTCGIKQKNKTLNDISKSFRESNVTIQSFINFDDCNEKDYLELRLKLNSIFIESKKENKLQVYKLKSKGNKASLIIKLNEKEEKHLKQIIKNYI